MKRLLGAFLMGVGGLVVATAAWAAEVTITSVGQTSDGMMLKVLMKGLAVDPTYESGLSAQGLRACEHLGKPRRRTTATRVVRA